MSRDTVIETISTSTHGRYVVDLPDGEGPFPLLVGFHGYGQNAETHLTQVLQRIPDSESWVRASVQGLHSFYNLKTQEVVASWMTRLHRELAIADNIRYIEAVVRALREDFPLNDVVVFEGFSQGVAMAFRAANAIPSRGLIVSGGDVPPDVANSDRFALPPLLLAHGRHDDLYPLEKYLDDQRVLRERGANAEFLEFEGGHECAGEFLVRAGALLKEWETRG